MEEASLKEEDKGGCRQKQNVGSETERKRKVTKEINRITLYRSYSCYSEWVWGSFMLGGQGRPHDEVNPG